MALLALAARPALLPFFLFCLGAALSEPTESLRFVFLGAAFVLAVAALALSSRWLGLVFLTAGWIATGLSLSTLESTATVPSDDRRTVTVEGEVEEVEVRQGRTRLQVAIARIDGAEVRVRARLYPSGPVVPLVPSQRIRVRTQLRPLEGRANPGEANAFERHRRRALLYGGGFDARAMIVLSAPDALARIADEKRRALAAAVEPRAPSADAAHLYLALAAGLRADLGDAVEDEFARSGLAHVLSVSGLHVAALGVAARALIRWLWVLLPWRRARRVDARSAALPLALIAVWAYTLFTGAQPPAVRSAVMTTLLFLGAGLKRRSDPLNALCLAGALLLCLEPAAVADLSTQLSVLSAAALILIGPQLREAVPIARPDPSRVSGWRLAAARLGETVLSTLCASVAVVATGAADRVGVRAAERDGVGIERVLSSALRSGLGVGCDRRRRVRGSADARGAGLVAGHVELRAVDAGLAPVCVVAVLGDSGVGSDGLGGRAVARRVVADGGARRPLANARSGVARSGSDAVEQPAARGFSRPRGDLSRGRSGRQHRPGSGGHHALVDGGGTPNGADTGDRFVLPYFKRRHVESLDLVALSHAHPDHALGLITVLKHVPTQHLWLPAGSGDGPLVHALLESKVEPTWIELGAPSFALGEATIEVLAPPVDRILLEGENDRSMVLRVRHGDVTFLLTGDVEEAGEENLDPGEVTVMKAPHHGSRTSSSEALLDKAKPRFVVFCVGKHNRFGFPSPEVVERYAALGARCYRTDLDGAITFKSDGHDVTVETFEEDGDAWRQARRASSTQ